VTCDEVRDQLQELVDHELGEPERAACEAHLKECEECARLYRQLSKFTTTVLQNVRPLRPVPDFPERIAKTFREAPRPLPRAGPGKRTFPSWPFLAALGVLAAGALAVFLWPTRVSSLARVTRNRGAVVILAYRETGWQRVQDRDSVRNGERVEILEPVLATAALELEPRGAGEVILRAPARVQFERFQQAGQADEVHLRPSSETPGRLFLRTRPGPLKALLVIFGKVRVELSGGGANEADVQFGASGAATVAVLRGSAKLSNGGEVQTVAEGFSRCMPQDGPCSPAVQLKREEHEWMEKP
jgi:anti-sigma factor RsiW